MRSEADVYSYVQDLEKHLQMTLFGGMADPEGAVLLVRGALADDVEQPDRHRAARHQPGIPEHAHRCVPPAPHLLEARHHLRVHLARIAAEQGAEDAS